MRLLSGHRCAFILCALILALAVPCTLLAQGGEPKYFAIRGAKVVPVSGPPLEDATVLMAHGVITAALSKYPATAPPAPRSEAGNICGAIAAARLYR